MIHLTCAKGLGDAIYMRAIVLFLTGQGERVRVYTRWPQVFRDTSAELAAPSEITGEVDIRHAAACVGCRHPTVRPLDMFTRECLRAGLGRAVPLQMSWRVTDAAIVERVRSAARGRPVLIYQPLKRAENYEQRLMRPDAEAYRAGLLAGRYFRVKLGSPASCDDDGLPCDLDLFGQTSVEQAFDVATIAERIYCEPSYLAILAEAMDKPYTCMFARAGLDAPLTRVSTMRPEFLFHKPHLATAVFDQGRNGLPDTPLRRDAGQ